MNRAAKPMPEGQPQTRAATRHSVWFTQRGYALYQTCARLMHRRLASLLTLLVMSLSLTLPVMLYLLLPELTRLTASSTRAPGLVAYLDTELTDLQGAELAARLARRADIDDVQYISKAQALDALRLGPDADHVNQTMTLLGENPLPGALLIEPAGGADLSGGEEHKRLASVLRETRGIHGVELDIEWLERLTAIRQLLKTAGWLFFTVLVIASLMVLSNTVRLESLRHARESSVVHMLGGSRSFRQRPFLYLGALLGGIAGLLACVFAWVLMHTLGVPVSALANSYAADFLMPLPGWADVIKIVMILAVLGTVTAIIAIVASSTHSQTNVFNK